MSLQCLQNLLYIKKNIVPLEVKSVITKENMTIGNVSFFSLSSAEQLQRRSVIMDRVILMCFLCLTKDSLLLPVVLVAPPVPWIMDDGVNIVPENLAILMACVILLQNLMDPIPYSTAPEYFTKLAQHTPLNIDRPIAFHPPISRVMSKLEEHAEAIKAHRGAIQSLSELSRRQNPGLPESFSSPVPPCKRQKRQRTESHESSIFEDN